AIIGGGFTGVSTAYHFSRRYPEKKVVLLEAKTLANGASGRNGGMVLNWLNGFEDAPDDLQQRIYTATRSGIDWIENTIKTHNLNVSCRRDGCMTIYTKADHAEAAHRHAEHVQGLGCSVEFL